MMIKKLVKFDNWVNNKVDYIGDNIYTEKHPFLKAFGLGMVEGAVTGIVDIVLVVGTIGTTKYLVDVIKTKIK